MKSPTGRASKAPWARVSRSLPHPASGTLFTVGQATAFISAQLKPSRDQSRSVTDKVRKRIRYAAAHRHLKQDQHGSIEFDELMLWAQGNAEWTASLSSFSKANSATANGVIEPFENRGVMHALPVESDAKDAALGEAHRRILELENTVSEHEAELATLRPLRAARVERGKAAIAAGKKGGRGHTR